MPSTCDMGPDNLERAGVPPVGGWAGIRLMGVPVRFLLPAVSPWFCVGTARAPRGWPPLGSGLVPRIICGQHAT